MDNKQPKRTGRPGDTILGKIEQVAKGENWSVSVECRDFQGQPIADPEDHDFIVTIGESERDENPFAEFHIWDPQIELTDPAKATFTASFKRSDMVLLAEGNEYFINYWSEPKDKSIEGRVRQARDAIRLLPSVEPKFVSSGRLAAVGFPSLLGSTSLTPYEIDPRDGFSGGKAPIGFVATIDGVTEAIPDTLVLERDQVVDRDITVSAFDARGDVRSTIFHQTTYPALSFVGLADVQEEAQDGGTVTVSLAGGWTGGYGNRTYTATSGAISGSNLILPISDAGTTTITLTATDEDGNTVPGTIQLTVVEATVSDTAPAQMAAPVVTSSTAGQFTATFSTPADDGGQPVTRYDIQYSTDGTNWTGVSDVTSPHTVTEVPAGGYFVQVRATNSVGNGPYSPSGEVTVEAATVPYVPTIVEASNIELSRDIAPDDAKPILLVVADVTPVGANINTNLIWQSDKFGTTDLSLSGAGVPVAKCAFATETGAGSATSSGQAVTADTNSAMVYAMEVGANQRFWNATSTSPMALRDTDALTDSTELPTFDTTMTLFRFNRTVRTSGIAIFALDALPAEFDPSQLFDENRRCKSRAAMAAYLGAEPIWSIIGLNADQLAAGETEGIETGAVNVNVGTDGEFTTIQQGSAGGGSGGDGGTASGMTTRMVNDATLLDGSYYAPIDDGNTAVFDPTGPIAQRISLQVSRSSVMTGEEMCAWVEGLTPEEEATWLFRWRTSQTGEWSTHVGLPAHMRQKGRASGYLNAFAWDVPGDHDLEVQVIPPFWKGVEFKGAVLTATVENRDPDVTFASDTWVVVPSGVGETPPAGTQVSTWMDAIAAVRGNGGGRILLHAGSTEIHQINGTNVLAALFNNNPSGEGVVIGRWGASSARPKINLIDASLDMRNTVSDPAFYVLLKGIEVYSSFNPVTGSGSQIDGLTPGGQFHLTANDCYIHNVWSGITSISPTTDYARPGQVAMIGTEITNWGNFGCYIQHASWILMRGNKVHQHPDAPIGYEEKNFAAGSNHPDHGPYRWSSVDDAYVVCSQDWLFSNVGWSSIGGAFFPDGVTPARAVQPVLRYGSSTYERSRGYIGDNLTEGGGYSLGGGSENEIIGAAEIVVLNGCVHIGTAEGLASGGAASGFWVVNCLLIAPNSPKLVNSYAGAWNVFGVSSGAGASKYPTWGSKPAHFLDNTIAWMMSPSNVNGDLGLYVNANDRKTLLIPTQPAGTEAAGQPEVISEGTLIWVPNYTLSDQSGPLVPNGIRSAGQLAPTLYRKAQWEQQDGTIITDTSYATASDAAILPVLDPTSTLLDADPSDRPVTVGDMFGRVRSDRYNPGAVAIEEMVEA